MSAGPLQRVLDVVRRQTDPDAHGPLADERLLARFAANGDPSAFELLVWRHGGLVVGTCRRLLSDAHLAEDAFQATFLALAKKPRAVRSGAALADWLHRVAVRVANKLRLAAARRGQIERGAARSVAVPADDPGRKEWNAIVDHEIDRLPEHLRRTVVLCYLDGRTTEETAQMLGCARGTVMSRLSTARERLRAQLTRRGVTLPAAGLIAFFATESPAALVPLAVRTALIETPPVLLAIVHGVFHAMTISKLKVATAIVLAIGFAGTGVGWVVVPGPGPAALQAEEPLKVTKPPVQPPWNVTDERIKDLEEKLDRLSKAIESKVVPAGPDSPAVRILMAALDRLIAEKASKSDAHAKFLKSAPHIRETHGQNVYLERLMQIEKRRSDLSIDKADMTEKLAQFKKLKDKKGEAAARQWITLNGTKIGFTEDRSETNRKIVDLEITKKRLLQTVGAKHPSVVELEELISIYRDMLKAGWGPPTGARPGSDGDKAKTDPLGTWVQAMEAKISDCDMLLKSLDDMFEIQQTQERAYAADVKKDIEFREEIGRLQVAIAGVDKALREIRTPISERKQ